jgi:hypothetical protein
MAVRALMLHCCSRPQEGQRRSNRLSIKLNYLPSSNNLTSSKAEGSESDPEGEALRALCGYLLTTIIYSYNYNLVPPA